MAASTGLHSRRALLAGGFAGLTALVAQALGRPARVEADGETMAVGGVYTTAVGTTSLQNSANNNVVFNAYSVPFGPNTGGGTALVGLSHSGTGVRGESQHGYGVHGSSGNSFGVYAVSGASAQPSVLGHAAADATGVVGHSGPSVGQTPSKTGVFGYANQDATSHGVSGQSVVGVGGHFSAGATGTALEADGQVRFSTAGLTAFAAGTKANTIDPDTNISAGSKIICTLESNQSGLFIQRVTKDAAENTFKVFLSANVLTGKTAKVAWFVIR